MRKKPVLLALLLVLLVVAVSCGEEPEVGDDKVLDFVDQTDPPDLGERPKESPTPAPNNPAVVNPNQPKPDEKPAAPEEKFFDVAMVADSPYFEPGNDLQMPAGFTLRVTNKDYTPERPTRSFTAENGAFDSKPMAPGAVWTHTFSGPGRYKVVDHKAPFIFATLEVG